MHIRAVADGLLCEYAKQNKKTLNDIILYHMRPCIQQNYSLTTTTPAKLIDLNVHKRGECLYFTNSLCNFVDVNIQVDGI